MNGFALCVGLGAAIGLWRVAHSSPKRQAAMLVNMGLLILFASLVGARLFYAWINRGYFSSHLLEIPQVWLGGLYWPGAVGGAWIAFLCLSLIMRGQRFSPGRLGDSLYPILPPLAISIWLGSWITGLAYGPTLPAGTWWAVPSLDESGAYSPRWPLQLLAALSLLAFFWLLEALVKKPEPAGRLSGLASVGLASHLLVASLLRADPLPTWVGMRMDTCMAIFFLILFMVTRWFFHAANQLWTEEDPLQSARNLSSQERTG